MVLECSRIMTGTREFAASLAELFPAQRIIRNAQAGRSVLGCAKPYRESARATLGARGPSENRMSVTQTAATCSDVRFSQSVADRCGNRVRGWP